MRVTRKGQVTIPKHIRDKLGIAPGSEVEFVDLGEDEGIQIVKSNERDERSEARKRFMRWLEKLEGTGDSGMSAEDVMKATRDRDVRNDY